jgi:hypothetical protein
MLVRIFFHCNFSEKYPLLIAISRKNEATDWFFIWLIFSANKRHYHFSKRLNIIFSRSIVLLSLRLSNHRNPDWEKLTELADQMATYRVFCSALRATGCPVSLTAPSFQSVARFFLAKPRQYRALYRIFCSGQHQATKFFILPIGIFLSLFHENCFTFIKLLKVHKNCSKTIVSLPLKLYKIILLSINFPIVAIFFQVSQQLFLFYWNFWIFTIVSHTVSEKSFNFHWNFLNFYKNCSTFIETFKSLQFFSYFLKIVSLLLKLPIVTIFLSQLHKNCLFLLEF